MKKGISMVSLIALITITLILLTTLTISGINTASNAKKIAFAMEIQMVQDAVDSYYLQNEIYPSINSVVLGVNSFTDSEKAQFIQNGETITNNQILLYQIDYSKINITDLKYGNLSLGETDIYVVSPKTGKVYYAKGIKIGNSRYFTSTDELKNLLNYNSGKNEQLVNDTVVFVPSTTAWINTDSTVTVKVPVTFNDVSITPNYLTSTVSDGYTIYTISVTKNTNISVKYKLKSSDTEYKEAKYIVSNVDKTSPSIQVGNQVLSNKTDNEKGYITNVIATDDLSKVKVMKYYNAKIEEPNLKSIIQQDGKNITNNTIPIEKGVSTITIYVEDNAGNYTYQYIDVII